MGGSTRKLKVYGGITFKEGKPVRTVIAAYTQKTVAQQTNSSLYYIRRWWSETGNKMEIEKAQRKPFTLVYPNGD